MWVNTVLQPDLSACYIALTGPARSSCATLLHTKHDRRFAFSSCFPPVLTPQMVAQSRNSETFIALCLLTVAGTSLITQRLGLSDTMGAFLAGVLLSETSYRTQVCNQHLRHQSWSLPSPATSHWHGHCADVTLQHRPARLGCEAARKYQPVHRNTVTLRSEMYYQSSRTRSIPRCACSTFFPNMLPCRSRFALALVPDRPQIEADIRPFKGLLLGLFFVTTGSSINITFLTQHWQEVGANAGLGSPGTCKTAIGCEQRSPACNKFLTQHWREVGAGAVLE